MPVDRDRPNPSDVMARIGRRPAVVGPVMSEDPTTKAMREALAHHLTSQRRHGRNERIAPFLGLTLPVQADKLSEAFRQGRTFPALYDRLRRSVGKVDRERFLDKADRAVYARLASGFIVANYQRNGVEVLSGSETHKFLTSLGSKSEGHTDTEIENLLIKDGKIVGAISSIMVDTGRSLSRHAAELRRVLASLAPICVQPPEMVIVTLGEDLPRRFRDSDITIKRLPLTLDDIVGLAGEVLQYAPPDGRPPLASLLPIDNL